MRLGREVHELALAGATGPALRIPLRRPLDEHFLRLSEARLVMREPVTLDVGNAIITFAGSCPFSTVSSRAAASIARSMAAFAWLKPETGVSPVVVKM